MSRTYLTEIKKRLNSEIKDTVSVTVVNNTLVIDIYKRDVLKWHYIIPNISIKLSSYISAKIVADTIIDRYKSYILDKYFLSKKLK